MPIYILFYQIHNVGNINWIRVVIEFLLFINIHKFLYVILVSSQFVKSTQTCHLFAKFLYVQYANPFLVVRSRNHKLSKTELRWTNINKSLGFLSFLLYNINRLFQKKKKSITFQNLVGVLVSVTFQLQHWFLQFSHAGKLCIIDMPSLPHVC